MQGPRTGRATGWTDRARRVVLGPSPAGHASSPQIPTHSSPLQGLPGPAPLGSGDFLARDEVAG